MPREQIEDDYANPVRRPGSVSSTNRDSEIPVRANDGAISRRSNCSRLVR